MTCKRSGRSVWGAPNAKLSDFSQKERPHHAFVRLVGGDKKSMELCPVYAENWNIRVRALPAKKKPDNLSPSQKAGEGAMRDAVADAGVSVKKQPVRKKRSRSSGGDAPVHPHTKYAPAITVPAPEPLTTQRTTSRSGRIVAASLLRGASQDYSAPRKRAPSTSTASNPYTAARRTSSRKFAHHPAPAQSYGAGMQSTDLSQATSTTTLGTTPSTAASSGMHLSQLPDHNMVAPATGASYYRLEDSSTQATPSHLYMPQAYPQQVADHVRIGIPPLPLPDRRSRGTPACATYQPYNPMPGLIHEPGQYATSAPYDYGRVACHGLDATRHAQALALGQIYVVDGSCPSTQPTIPLDSDTGNRDSRMDSLLPATGTWPGNPGFATPPSPNTPSQSFPGAMNTYDPSGDTKYVGVAYQDFNSRGDYRPPTRSSLSSSTMPALAPGTSECDLKTVHQVKTGCAPQAHAPPLVDDDVGVVTCHNANDEGQDPPNVCETCQVTYPPEGEYSIAWSAPSAIPSISYERSAGIGGVENNTYVHDAKVPLPVQDRLALPRTISNADRHLPKQSSYSELSQALGEPAPTSMQPSTTLAASAMSTVPPSPHNEFYAHSSSSALVGPYARPQDPRPRRRPPSVWYEHSPRIAKCAQSASTLR